MSESEPPWARTPLKGGSWHQVMELRTYVSSTGRRTQRAQVWKLSKPEAQALAEEQRARARQLAKAMGFTTTVSDNHAAKIVEALSPFLPGLTIESPTTRLDNANDVGARWEKPKPGRKTDWSNEALLDLLEHVERLRSEDTRRVDDDAIDIIIRDVEPPFGRPWPDRASLRTRLSEARRVKSKLPKTG